MNLQEENAKLRERVADGESAVKFVNAQYAKLRGELERRELKWQTGPVPDKNAAYLWRCPGGTAASLHLSSTSTDGMEWAGPIEPPEEE